MASSPAIHLALTTTVQSASPATQLTFQSPLAPYLSSIQPSQVLAIVFSLVFVVWLIYTFVVAYHWLRYGHRSAIGIPALVVHLFVSAVLFLMAAGGFVGA